MDNGGRHDKIEWAQVDLRVRRGPGAKLGCFLASQRVLDGDEFFVDVEPGDVQGASDNCEQDVND